MATLETHLIIFAIYWYICLNKSATTVVRSGNITKNKKIEVLKDEPCALSITNNISPKVEDTNGTTELKGNYVLFISKKINKGDKLFITRENGENIIAVAGKPSFHTTHYEISLLIQERA